jgi:membrane peptidoglycan carboxypeptidase
VNFEGLARAVWENLSPVSGSFLEGSGGSSITQQLVKRLYFSEDQQSARSFDRKAREIVFALQLSDDFGKEQVLTWYLNEISYGGMYFGIEAASQGYFGKPAAELTLAEAALLAGIPQSPAAYDPRANPEAAVARRNMVLDLLAQHQSLQVREAADYPVSLEAIEAAKAAPLEMAPDRDYVLYAPHFVFTYLEPELEAMFGREALLNDGLVVTTTIDLNLQLEAERILEENIANFEASSNTHNGAAVVIDPRTGELLVMVGSRDHANEEIQGQNNNLLAHNSPGSSFKPFVYLGLFLQGNSGPGVPIDDSPIRYQQPDGTIFSPTNPDKRNHGWVTIRNALGNSYNVPAFRAAQAVGVHEVVRVARHAGLTGLDGSYGPAISIGGVDVKGLDLAYAYTVLANGGIMRGQRPAIPHPQGERGMDPVSILSVARNNGEVVFQAERLEHRQFPEQQVFLVNSILSDPNAQCQTFGCGGISVPGYQVAVKTGTSEPFDPRGPNAGKIGETWAFGYTPDVVVGIWAGNSDNAPITNITSSSIAFRAMRDLILTYYGGRPATPFTPPPGVVRVQACFASPAQMCVNDYFIEASLRAFTLAPTAAPRPPISRSNPDSQEQQRRQQELQRQIEEQRQEPEEQRREQEGDGNRNRGRGNNDDDD